MTARPHSNTRLLFKALAICVAVAVVKGSALAGVNLPALQGRDTTAGDMFGYTTSAHGGIGVAGARLDDTDDGINAGSAYLFDITSGNQLHKLSADDAESDDLFGRSVAVFGNTALVGAPLNDDAGNSSGSAYLFNTQTGRQRFKLTANDAAASDQFGHTVAMNGNTAAVAAPWEDQAGINAGALYLFDTTTGTQQRKLTAPDANPGDLLGYSLSIDGNLVLGSVGKPPILFLIAGSVG